MIKSGTPTWYRKWRTALHNSILTNLCGDAWIRDNECYLTIKGLGSRYRDTTIFKTRNGDVVVRCGCFYGTLAEFVDEVEITHGDSKYAKEYLAFVELAKIHFGIDEV